MRSNFTRAKDPKAADAFKYLILRALISYFMILSQQVKKGGPLTPINISNISLKEPLLERLIRYSSVFNTSSKESTRSAECHFTSIKLTKRQLRFQH
jgi:hypothetical protein